MASKKAKTTATAYFEGYDIKYKGPDSMDPLSFKYYDKDRVVMGRTMKEWLRFAVCWWHTWRGNGADIFGMPGPIERPWDGTTLEAALARVDVCFEFCQRLGIEYYCFHDRDVSPEGATIAETETMFDEVVEKMLAKQKETGLKLLWGTCNLFSHKRYMHGACTNPDPAIVCQAAAQVKKCLEVTKKLDGENFVMWGGRDGYMCLLNTDYGREQENYASFLKSMVSYVDEIGFKGALLLEPKPREPATHQYNYDAETTLGFLDRFGLTDRFSINLEANHGVMAGHSGEHEVAACAARGKLGSIDANRDEQMLGWDTDMFPNNPALATYIMKTVIEQGGLAPGGLNFDAKVRRESTEIEDLFIAHINGMDTMARGLLAAAKLIEDGTFDKMKADRYSGFVDTPLGKKIAAGEATLAEMAAAAKKAGDKPVPSGRAERYESVFNAFAYK